jgi:hypothetical protein
LRGKLNKLVVVDAVSLAEQRGSSPWMFVRDLGELSYDRMSTEGAAERSKVGIGIAATGLAAVFALGACGSDDEPAEEDPMTSEEMTEEEEYMAGEERYPTFFAYISLFTAAMLAMVMSRNLFHVLLFWELMGIMSYLLIGFFFKKIAAQQAFRKGAAQANPTLLEPIMQMKITVPEAYMGDVMSDLNSKRGQVQGMNPRESGFTTIEAFAPAAEIQRYATDLRSITQGRGYFSVEFSHYQPVPPHLTDSIIEGAKEREAAHV